MNIEESPPEDKIKGQVKLLVERIRTIENRQTQVENELTQFKSDVTEQKEIFTSTMNDAINQVQVVIAEFNLFKPSLSSLGGMKADLGAFSEKLENLTQSFEAIQSKIDSSVIPLETKLSELVGSIQKGEESQSGITTQLTSLQEKLNSELTSLQQSLQKGDEFQSNVTTQLNSLQEELNTELSSLQQSLQKGDEFQSKVTSQLNSLQEELNSELSHLQDKLTQLEGSIGEGDSVSIADFGNFKTEQEKRFEGIGNRIVNVEKHAGITTGALLETSFDSGGMLRELVSELFGSGMIDSLMPQDIANPILVIESIKKIIMNLCGMDDTRDPNISDILLRYADKLEGMGVSGRKELFVAFNTDVRRICEIGQSVLMAIGQKRNYSRRICQEANKLAGKWTSEELLKNEQGVASVLELFDTLQQEFQEP